MKTIKIAIIGILLFATSIIEAQVSVNINLGATPSWGPKGHANMEYYYLPDIQSYYDIRRADFIFFERGRWLRAKHLPARYHNYNLHNGRTYAIDGYHGRTPYKFHNTHKVRYTQNTHVNHHRADKKLLKTTPNRRNHNPKQDHKQNNKHFKDNHNNKHGHKR